MALFRKALSESAWTWLGCAAILFLFAWVHVWITSRIEMSRFESILRQFDDFHHLLPVSVDRLLSYPARVSLTFDEPLLIVALAFWAVTRGSDCISGEIGRGTMEMLLAQPVSRLNVLGTQIAVTILGTVLLVLVTWGGIAVGIGVNTVKEEPPTWYIPFLNIDIISPFADPEPKIVPMSTKVDARQMVPALVNMTALGVCIAGVATFLSSFDRYRWRTIGMAAALLVVQYIQKIAGMAVPEARWLERCSLFGLYEPVTHVTAAMRDSARGWDLGAYGSQGEWIGLGPLGSSAVLFSIGVAGYVLAAVIFCRRDLPAPL
jgi:ABC-2 type transport system permease protein